VDIRGQSLVIGIGWQVRLNKNPDISIKQENSRVQTSANASIRVGKYDWTRTAATTSVLNKSTPNANLCQRAVTLTLV